MWKKVRIGLLLALILFIGIFTYRYCSIDRTAEIGFENQITYKGNIYIPANFAFTEEGKTIAKADGWDIMEIPEDKTHSFLAVRSFSDNYTVVRKDYVIPAEGEISSAYVSKQYRITDINFLNAMKAIIHVSDTETFDIKTDNLHRYVKTVHLGYGDCQVGTEFVGYIGCINSQWVFIGPDTERNDDDTSLEQIYRCRIIPRKYEEAIKQYPYYTYDTAEIVSYNNP